MDMADNACNPLYDYQVLLDICLPLIIFSAFETLLSSSLAFRLVHPFLLAV